jgi:hypothetical protein
MEVEMSKLKAAVAYVVNLFDDAKFITEASDAARRVVVAAAIVGFVVGAVIGFIVG